VRGSAATSYGRSLHATLQRFFELAKERAQEAQGSLFDPTPNPTPNPSPYQGEGKRGGEETQRPTFQGEEKTQASPLAKGGKRGVKDLVSVVELLKIFDEKWIDDWYDGKKQKEEYRKQGRESLKKFYAALPLDQILPKYLEQGFHLHIGEYTLRGKIDRADEVEPGKLEIIDYKTGKPKDPQKLSLEDKEQLLIYQIAVTEVLGEQPRLLSYWYLDDNSKVSFLGTGEEVAALKEKIVATVAAIQKSDFAATPSPYICKNCDFKEICEYRQL